MTRNRRGFLGALAVACPATAKLLENVPEVESINRITPSTDSIYVLSTEEHMTDEAYCNIQKAWSMAFEGITAPKLLILDFGMHLEKLTVSVEVGP
jgi:hypothetical protein